MDLYFIEFCPIGLLRAPERREITRSKFFDGLKEDISKRGLGSPLYAVKGCVRWGVNRYYACLDLGWGTVPVIWQRDPPIEGVRLRSPKEVQALISDGKVVAYRHHLEFRGATLLKTGKHPEIKRAYFGRDMRSRTEREAQAPPKRK